MFDTVLLLTKGQGWNHVSELREALLNEISKTVLKNGIGKNVSRNGKSRGFNGGKGRGKK